MTKSKLLAQAPTKNTSFSTSFHKRPSSLSTFDVFGVVLCAFLCAARRIDSQEHQTAVAKLQGFEVDTIDVEILCSFMPCDVEKRRRSSEMNTEQKTKTKKTVYGFISNAHAHGPWHPMVCSASHSQGPGDHGQRPLAGTANVARRGFSSSSGANDLFVFVSEELN